MDITEQRDLPGGKSISTLKLCMYTTSWFCIGVKVRAFCDGEVFKEHPLFSTDRKALQIVIYYDDVETANSLGSYRGKHKLSG